MRGLASLLLVGLALLVWAVLVHEPPQIAVENRSGVDLEEVDVVVGDRVLALGPLSAGSLDRHALPIVAEGPARLRLHFADGSVVEAAAGWMSPGREDLPRVVVHAADSIEVRDEP